MDEYIKREDALDAVLFALVGTGYQSRAIYAIRDVPATDVAPRAEVAREIFEELDKKIIHHIPDLYTFEIYAELKNKYTGAPDICVGHTEEKP